MDFSHELFCRDTVDSVGIIPKRLPFTTSNTIVRTFRHAVSLDERRAKFKANLWNRPTSEEAMLGTVSSRPTIDDPSSLLQSTTAKPISNLKMPKTKKTLSHKENEEDRVLSTLERKYSEKMESTNIEEVWFAVRISFIHKPSEELHTI